MGKLVLYGVGGIVAAVVALRLLLALFGALFALAWFVVVRIVPLALLGWFVLWAWRRWKEQTA